MELIETQNLSPISTARQYSVNGCIVLASHEPYKKNGSSGIHISISHRSRYPTWDEIKYVRYKLGPSNKTMIIVLPPKQTYVNVHPNCFHLWEEE